MAAIMAAALGARPGQRARRCAGWACVKDPAAHVASIAAMPTIPFELLEEEMTFEATRAQGPGGQNVNKVSNAVHLRFDVRASRLPDDIKSRLLARRDQRISSDGVIVIKAQRFRSLEKNRAEALARLTVLVTAAATIAPARQPTRPTAASKRRRVESKVRRGRVKALRGRVNE